MSGNPVRNVLRFVPGHARRLRRRAQAEFDDGNALSDRGRHAEAVAAYGRAIDLEPAYAEAFYRCGISLRDQHDFVAAAASYRRALAIRPAYAEAHNNLGVILQSQGDAAAALASFRCAVALGPDFSQPYLNLGRLCTALGDHRGAAQSYRSAAARGVEPEVFGHLLNAAQGITTERAPTQYARAVFDSFAEFFDHRLVDELEYRIPQMLCERVRAALGTRELRVLDLGCGTGLCGLHLGTAGRLTGVDLSPAMLALARARKLYDELVEADAADYLRSAPAATFEVVLAADVFIYIGMLAVIFDDVARVLTRGGVFAFSIEVETGAQDFTLQTSGRYAQSVQYIRRLAAASGFSETEACATAIRGAAGLAAPGYVFVLRKNVA